MVVGSMPCSGPPGPEERAPYRLPEKKGGRTPQVVFLGARGRPDPGPGFRIGRCACPGQSGAEA
ncbi:hypothetical protein CTA1_2612 [Colletotrichum tanaceti]|uniref:Uncharacterized protein n=1 Tax=Colletotrichum tanaceti TaxID=1306861 RepID=A0A4U6WZT7_9PEZI|nr:hypothetical protein CTA1_2612 [Colletotrichum tanaceti]